MLAHKVQPQRIINAAIVPKTPKIRTAGDGPYLIKTKHKETYSIIDKAINDTVTYTESATQTEAAELHWMADAAYNKSN